MQSILLYSMVFLGGGDAVLTSVEMLGRRGGANFLLKCHTLCPICLTFLVVHFYTYAHLCFYTKSMDITISQSELYRTL